MLNGINNNTSTELQQQISQTSGMDKSAIIGKKNPYQKLDKNLFVDELDISNEALSMYQKDLDIKKFSKLALSDSNDNSHNSIVAELIGNGIISFDESDIADSLYNNEDFMNDLVNL